MATSKAAPTADALETLVEKEAVTATGSVVQRAVTEKMTQAQKIAAPAKAAKAQVQATAAPSVTAKAVPVAAPPTFLREGVALPLDAAHDLTPDQLERILRRNEAQASLDPDLLD